MKPIIAYAIVKKDKPKIVVGEIYADKKGVLLNKDEKWVTVIIKQK